MPALIEADALEKRFGNIKAVHGISLTVMSGEVLGFLGPNGAGKSTTIKMITAFSSRIQEPRGSPVTMCRKSRSRQRRASDIFLKERRRIRK